MSSRRASLWALLLLLSGCVPNATTYYRPWVDGGKVVSARCVPTESNVDFQVGPLPIRARANEGRNATIVSLTLLSQPAEKTFPELNWQTFRFTAGNFAVRDLGNGVTTENLMVRATRHDRSGSVIEPFHAPTDKRHYYWVDVYLPGPAPESFEIMSPSVVVDGKEYRFPPIRFERKVWMGISPFNC